MNQPVSPCSITTRMPAMTLVVAFWPPARRSHRPFRDEPADTQPAASAGSPGDHVSFFVLGKSWNFTQDVSGDLSLIDMGFFAEIFKLAGGEVTDARMQLVAEGSEPIPVRTRG